MKINNIKYLIIFLFISCSKDESNSPKIIWTEEYPLELQEYCCESILNRPNSPILISSDELLFFGRSNDNNLSKIFKINPNTFEELTLWDDEIGWSLGNASLFIENDKLFFDARNESIYQVNLPDLKTINVISANSSKDGMQKIDSLAFVIRNTSGISTFEINLIDGSEKLIYTANPYQSGTFVSNPTPFVCKPLSDEYILITCEMQESKPILTKYNITRSETEWQIPLDEFNDENLPTTSEAISDYIVVNSKTKVSVRDFSSGELLWTKNKVIISTQEKPFVYESVVIITEENSISSYDLSNGKKNWTILEGENGIRWGSIISFNIVQNYLFLDHNPINLTSGQMYWTSLDNWDEQDYEFLKGNPAVDISNKCLYYTGNDMIYKVELPN